MNENINDYTDIWGTPTRTDGPLVVYVCTGCGHKSLFERTMAIHAHSIHIPAVSYRATAYVPESADSGRNDD